MAVGPTISATQLEMEGLLSCCLILFNFGMPCRKEQQGGKGVLPSCRFIPRLWSLAAQDVLNKPLIDKQEVLREEDVLNGEQERLYANCF